MYANTYVMVMLWNVDNSLRGFWAAIWVLICYKDSKTLKIGRKVCSAFRATTATCEA